MSDPEVPQPEKPKDVNDVVDSARAGLDEAAAAGADVPAARHEPTEPDAASEPAVDPDLAAFEEMEKAHPGTFSSLPEGTPAARDGIAGGETPVVATPTPSETADDDTSAEIAAAAAATTAIDDRSNIVADAPTSVTSVYDEPRDAETHVLPSEPVVVAAAAPAAMQPIFVQAPEPPRDRGNRGTAGLIGLLATLVFAVLFLGVVLAIGAISGEVIADNIGDAALAPLTTWGFWTPVVVFFLSFWLLGAIINRGPWGRWVIFGLLVGVASYFGYILGQLFEAPFWMITASQGAELVNEQLFSPLAIAAFVLGRELTIWFGAWVARSGARKTELNAEAQREYERTLEAGPTLPR
ncbi:DMT family transporter [Microbacterium sp. M28]|uniref:DMT family transporter n=1 Tax=Microbacterium sp. M28 TaxID=2962064 RepID=UPI0021F4D981|nr:DMT family transporter [Microbacterium sp. M28]UYO97762.1 DMT family transporter [Microbacterium sp. M28]